MNKFTSRNCLKIFTLALGLLGTVKNVLATDCDAFQTAVNDIVKFNNSGDCCAFDGVTCQNGAITEIKLEGIICPHDKKNYLDEVIKSFSDLKSLKKISIIQTNSCDFPQNVCQLKSLNSLVLNINFSKSSIPECLSELTNLEELDLGKSGLNGKIPESFGNLKNLKVLKLNNNKLSGYIPYSFKNLENLTELNLNGNTDITGYIPIMPKLKTCDYTFTTLCKTDSTTCTGDIDNYCTKEIIEASNKNNGNPDPSKSETQKEVKKHHRTKVTYIPCSICLAIFILGIIYEIISRKHQNPDELVDVVTEKRDKFNRVVSSSKETMTRDSYLKERRIGIIIVGIIGVVLFFVLE